MLQSIKTLKNGVEKFPLVIGNDFNVVQKNIFDIHDDLSNFDAESAFNDRVENNFEGTYKITIERNNDYKRFINKVRREQEHQYNEIESLRMEVRNDYYNDRITKEDAIEKLDNLDLKLSEKCNCKICSYSSVSFENWKSGKTDKGEKLGKSMRKAGFSQELLDFYSMQIKTEKTTYLTISGLVQHIAGMSNLAKEDSWDGYNGTSCQDSRFNSSMSINLVGSIHDDKLFIAMLHDNLEDVENMQDKLLARTMMRFMTVDGVNVLLPAHYYGNNETKSALEHCLSKLNEVMIFSREQAKDYNSYDDLVTIREKANGSYTHYDIIDIHIELTVDEDVIIECPLCGGSGDYETYSAQIDGYIEVKCPCCGGDGEYEVNVYQEIDEWIEQEEESEILPYIEGYDHDGCEVRYRVNIQYVRDAINEHVKSIVKSEETV